MSRALVVGSGGLRGGYDAGVTATLCRLLGPTYFDTIYVCSVGAYAGSFYAAGQPDIIEEVWKEHSHGTLLVNPLNILKGKSILDLDYMLGLFRRPPFKLDTEAILASPERLCFVFTDYASGEARYMSPKDKEEVFLFMRASAAIPMLHPPVFINGQKFFDGAMTDPLPVERALADGHGEIVVVCNKPRLEIDRQDKIFMFLVSLGYKGDLKRLRQNYYGSWNRVEKAISESASVRAIRPTTKLPFRWNLDSAKRCLNEAVDLGINDALAFLKT